MEQRVSNAIANSARGFHYYYELKDRHSGRYPAPVRDAWRVMSVVLGSRVDIPFFDCGSRVRGRPSGPFMQRKGVLKEFP
jgi:hypothetical protein